MIVELKPGLESQLRDVAQRQSLSVPELVERILTEYLNRATDEASTWVKSTQGQLPRVWEAEDFSSWSPPHAS